MQTCFHASKCAFVSACAWAFCLPSGHSPYSHRPSQASWHRFTSNAINSPWAPLFIISKISTGCVFFILFNHGFHAEKLIQLWNKALSSPANDTHLKRSELLADKRQQGGRLRNEHGDGHKAEEQCLIDKHSRGPNRIYIPRLFVRCCLLLFMWVPPPSWWSGAIRAATHDSFVLLIKLSENRE